MRTLYFAAVVSVFFLFSSPILSGWKLDVYHTSNMMWPYCEFRTRVCSKTSDQWNNRATSLALDGSVYQRTARRQTAGVQRSSSLLSTALSASLTFLRWVRRPHQCYWCVSKLQPSRLAFSRRSIWLDLATNLIDPLLSKYVEIIHRAPLIGIRSFQQHFEHVEIAIIQRLKSHNSVRPRCDIAHYRVGTFHGRRSTSRYRFNMTTEG